MFIHLHLDVLVIFDKRKVLIVLQVVTMISQFLMLVTLDIDSCLGWNLVGFYRTCIFAISNFQRILGVLLFLSEIGLSLVQS